jgi:hypothetical protein
MAVTLSRNYKAWKAAQKFGDIHRVAAACDGMMAA